MNLDGMMQPSEILGVDHILTVSSDHDNDLPSQFGDDDALLSVAPSEFSTIQTVTSVAPSSNKADGSDSSAGTSGLKTSELRKKMRSNIMNDKLQIQKDDPSTSYNRRKSFHINQMGLIGREGETAMLRSSLDRIIQEPIISDQDNTHSVTNPKGIVLLGGPSGVGKSSIVREVHLQMERDEIGYFVESKFGMNSSDVPYSGVCDALGMICQHIFQSLPDSKVRGTLEQELGEESSLLCQLVPELKPILYTSEQQDSGEEAAVVGDIDVEELENSLDRLRFAFRILMRALCAEFAPLVLFLDDLQWADVSSLQVLDYIISDTQNPHPLMIIGCYRSDEVDENSLLYNKISSLRDKSSRFSFSMTEIKVAPFAASDVEKIVTMAFGSASSEDTFKLSEVCVKRTLGNPFFIIEFLKMLRNEGLIAYDEPTNQWTWDLERIEDATMSTANVVVLLQERMRKLSGQVQSFLQYAAHLGSSFSKETIKIIWQTYGRRVSEGEMEPLEKLLKLVVEGNYLEKLDATHYRWVHDKVQEAALYLAGTLRETHYLDIGTSLYYCLEAKQLEEDLFNVVDLINKGNIKKRPEFAAVNLRAAEKARSISAFQAASNYASHGIELLKDTRWSQNRLLTLKLYTIGAEMEQALGNVAAAERYSAEVLSRAELDTMDTLPLKLARASTLSNVELKYDEAVTYCLDLLKELGCKLFWSRKTLKVQAVVSLLKTIRRVKKLPTNYFDKVKMMTDEKQKGITTLVSRLVVSAYLSGDVMLSVLGTCKLVEMSLDQGLNEHSAKCLSTLSTATIIVQQDFKAATKFNEMALSLLKKHRRMHNGEVMFNAHCNGHLWVKPKDECLAGFWEAYSLSMRSGDTEFSCWSLYVTVTLPFLFGKPIPQALSKCPAVMHQFEEAAQSQQIMILKIMWQLMLHLHDESCEEPHKLEGEIFSKSKDTVTDSIQVATVLLCESDLLLFYGHYTAAADLALEHGDLYQKSLPANYATMFELFRRGISLYAAALQTNKKKYKKEAKRVRAMVTKRVLAVENPEYNFFKTMLDAEQFAVDKKYDAADKHYDEAIQSAMSRGHLHHVGLFSERYADFLMRARSSQTKSNEQLKQAIEYYKQWGANGKVKALQSKLTAADLQKVNR